MKRDLLLAAVCCGLNAGAQTLDAKLGTEISLPTCYANTVLLPKVGVSVHQGVIGRFGVSVGIDYIYTNMRAASGVVSMCCFGGSPDVRTTKKGKPALQIPVGYVRCD